MVLTMTHEQQYLFECLQHSTLIWNEEVLRNRLEAGEYQLFADERSAGQFLAKFLNSDDPLPQWAARYFNWENYVKDHLYGTSMFPLPCGRYIHIFA